jgi:hypothetical protein
MDKILKSINRIDDFSSKSKKNERLVYYSSFTLLFSVVSLIIFNWYYRYGKSVVFDPDGFTQHMLSLTYYGTYLREIISNLVSTGRLSIPLWDFTIGYGSDIISTLNFYVMGDPLNLLSVFFLSEKTEILYNFLLIFRMYLSGITFSMLCKRFNLDRFSTL